MDERAQDARPRQALQVGAGLAAAAAHQYGVPDAEAPADEPVEIDAGRHHVAPRVRRLERLVERRQRLRGDQRDVVAAAAGRAENVPRRSA